MKSIKFTLLTLGSIGLLFLSACNNSEPTATNTPEPTTKTETLAKTDPKTDHSHPSKGGQVVETGKYHLELVPVTETKGT